MSELAADVLTAPVVKPKSSRDDWTMRAFMGVIGLYLIVALAMPLYTMLSKSVEDHDGLFIGIANYIEYFSTPALTYSINNSLFIAVITTITITLGVFLPAFWALLIAALLTFLKIFRSNIVIHNLSEILIYAGIALLFVPLFNLFWITILLLIISVYDAFAVWQSKHMIKLAQFQTGNRLFAGFFVSKKAKVKTIKGTIAKKVKGTVKRGKVKKVRAREAILGGGDIAFPLIFAGVVMESLLLRGTANAFLATLIIPVVLTLVLLGLLLKGEQGKFYPAMPFLTAGCLIGAAIVFLLTGSF